MSAMDLEPPKGDALAADDFEETKKDPWDVVVVFERGDNNEKDDDWKRWAKRFAGVGLELYAYESLQRDEVLIKLRAPFEVLAAWAERIGYETEYKQTQLEEFMTARATEAGIPDWKIPPNSTRFKPYKYQRGPFKADLLELYRRAPRPFGALHRVRLIQSLIDAPRASGGCQFDVLRRLSKKQIKGYLVLHDDEELKELQEDFVCSKSFLPSALDVSLITEYFGARLGFVFSFRQHFTSSLTPLALWGIVVFGISRKDVSNMWVASFAIIAAIWGVVCLQLWRRVESTNRMKWTGESLVEDTLARPSFHGKTRPSPIDGLPEVFYPDKQRKQKQLENFLPMGVLIAVFLLCFWGTILLGFRVNDNNNPGVNNSPAAATAIYVQVLNLLYSKVAVALNKRENWRTEKDHTDNLTFKMATFQVINSFLPLYFTAFIRPHLGHGGCSGNGGSNANGDACIRLLGTTLVGLYLSQIIVTKITEQLVPLAMNRYQRWAESRGKEFKGREFSHAELELMLTPTDPDLFHVTIMTSNVVEFGYVTLFVFAFPLAPLLSWFNGILSLRSTCHVLMYRQQRVIPHAADGIGSFNTVFDVLAKISVVTNAALLVFAANLSKLSHRSPKTKMWIFIVIQYILFTVQMMIDLAVPDELESVKIQRKRGDLFRKTIHAGKFQYDRPEEDFDHADAEEMGRKATVQPVELHDLDDEYVPPSSGEVA